MKFLPEPTMRNDNIVIHGYCDYSEFLPKAVTATTEGASPTSYFAKRIGSFVGRYLRSMARIERAITIHD